MIKNPVLYILECQHVMPGTMSAIMVYCHQCEKCKPVKNVHVYEWCAWCLSCTYRRYTGLARGLADIHARSHSSGKPDHQVGITYLPRPQSRERFDALVKQGIIPKGEIMS